MLTPRTFASLVVVAAALVLAASPASAEPVHSPMTPAVVARLKAVLASSDAPAKNAFVKIGDSNTANPAFLACYGGQDVELGEHGALETTRAFFAGHRIDGFRSSFDRVSVSATIGWLAGQPLQGAPSHLA